LSLLIDNAPCFSAMKYHDPFFLSSFSDAWRSFPPSFIHSVVLSFQKVNKKLALILTEC